MKRIVPLLVIAALIGACGQTARTTGTISVIASMYPAAFLAEQIGGEHISVSTLTNPGTDPHDLELSPKRTIELLEADVVLWFGGIQPAVDQAVDESARKPNLTIDLTDGNGAGKTPKKGLDPHIWLDPNNMADAAERTLAALVAAAPEKTDEFEANATALNKKLADLDSAFQTTLTNCRVNTFVTSHAAFGHLADAYGLTQVAIAGLDSHAEPNTAKLAAIAETIRSENLTTVFTEPLASDALAKTVAAETGAEIAVLDPIEGLTAATKNENYLTLMEANLAALAKALECR